MLQQTFSGHGFSLAQFLDDDPLGCFVPGFIGPHTALGISAGKGGVPLLRHIQLSRQRSLSQVFHPAELYC